MEGLLLFIATFLGLPVIAGITVAVELFGCVLSGLASLLELLLNAIAGNRKSSPVVSSDAPAPPDSPPPRRKWGPVVRRVQYGMLGALAITLAMLLLVNFVFLDPVVGWIARRVEARTGIALTYTSMEGNLFTGRFRFMDVRISRPAHATTTFDLRMKEVAADLAVWDLMRGHRTLKTLAITSLDGTVRRLASADQKGDSGSSIRFTLGDAERPIRPPRGSFFVRDLAVTHGRVVIEDRTSTRPVTYPVVIDSISARPLRSHYLWFDLLFRSNLHVTVDGTAAVVENQFEGELRHTRWAITDIPAPVLASLVGGPFSLFTAGRLDVDVRDSWQITEDPVIDMAWLLRLRDVRASVPEHLPAVLRAPVGVLVQHVNTREEPWELGFNLTMREGQFAGATTLDARQIWAGALEALLRDSLQLSDDDREALKARARSGLERFKAIIQRRNDGETADTEPDPAAEN